jgi:hypothetical protein
MAGMYFPKEEYQARWARVLQNMKKKGYDIAVVWGRSAGSFDRCGDVLYLINFYSGHSAHEYDTPLWQARSYAAVILQQGQEPELHMDEAGYPGGNSRLDPPGSALHLSLTQAVAPPSQLEPSSLSHVPHGGDDEAARSVRRSRPPGPSGLRRLDP